MVSLLRHGTLLLIYTNLLINAINNRVHIAFREKSGIVLYLIIKGRNARWSVAYVCVA